MFVFWLTKRWSSTVWRHMWPNISQKRMETGPGQSARLLNPLANLGRYMAKNWYLNTQVRPHFPSSSTIDRLICVSVVIDAEVRYAVRHEYALTAIDVLARRTRLSFLNARTALDALPQVVDIMAEELGWSLSERERQINKALNFFGSMGLSPAYVAAHKPRPIPRGTWEKVQTGLWDACIAVIHTVRPGKATEVTPAEGFAPGRSKFEPGEVSTLRNAFVARKKAAEEKVHLDDILDILKDVPGYAEISDKELDYVLNEAGMIGQIEFNFDEFIEVSHLLPLHLDRCEY